MPMESYWTRPQIALRQGAWVGVLTLMVLMAGLAFAPSTASAGGTGYCGDGITDSPYEDCDDGNFASGDGCSAGCQFEYAPTPTPRPTSTPSPAPTPNAGCGNGIYNPGELCDDGNQTVGDGCSMCTIDVGWQCSGLPSVCTNGSSPTPTPEPTPYNACGNGQRQKGEQCDDGNPTAGDGCDATCIVEGGWTCAGYEPDTCTPTATPTPEPTATPTPELTPIPTPTPVGGYICGDGVVFGGWTVAGGPRGASAEQCDDGNTTSGDGCSGYCAIESGYTCSGSAPSVCSPTATPTPAPTATPEETPEFGGVCGDQVRGPWSCRTILPGRSVTCEECDDGNTTPGDGCDATCNVEPGWTCEMGEKAPDYCTLTATPTPEPTATPGPGECGNGLVEEGSSPPDARGFNPPPAGEECDDGNTTAGDGCNSSCGIEAGYTCEGEPSDCYLPLGLDRIVLWPAYHDFGTIIARGHTGGVVPLDVDGGMEIVVRDAGSAPGLGQEVATSFTAAECVADRRGGFICTDEGTPGRLVNRVKIVQDRRSGGYKIKVYLATTVMELGLYGPAEMDIVMPSGATYRGVAPNCRGGVPPEERLFCTGGVS